MNDTDDLRTYIATMALQGLLANPDSSGDYLMLADIAVTYADALITRLNADKKDAN